ncbi:MAG TPA: DUF2563 family protein [Mycobacteriales bacterium]|nr:DUF2563 family protein [Mycobacteriales bacterium]
MAPKNDGKDGLVVDPKAITTSSDVADHWGTFLNTLLPKLRAIKVKAGTFPEATEFANTVTTRITELVANVEGSSNALKTIGTDLKTVAASYTDTENQNTDDAAKLAGLVHGVDQFLPGAKGTMPAPVPTSTVQLPPPNK